MAKICKISYIDTNVASCYFRSYTDIYRVGNQYAYLNICFHLVQFCGNLVGCLIFAILTRITQQIHGKLKHIIFYSISNLYRKNSRNLIILVFAIINNFARYFVDISNIFSFLKVINTNIYQYFNFAGTFILRHKQRCYAISLIFISINLGFKF